MGARWIEGFWHVVKPLRHSPGAMPVRSSARFLSLFRIPNPLGTLPLQNLRREIDSFSASTPGSTRRNLARNMSENSGNRRLFFGHAASVESFYSRLTGFSLVPHAGRSRTGTVLSQIARTPVFQQQLAYNGRRSGFEVGFFMFLPFRRFVSPTIELCKATVRSCLKQRLWHKPPGLLKTSTGVLCGGSDTTGPRCPVLYRPQHLNSTGNYVRYIEDSSTYNRNLALRAGVNHKVRS